MRFFAFFSGIPALCLATLLQSGVLGAQAAVGPQGTIPPTLTLEEAIRIGLSNNTNYLSILNDQDGLKLQRDFRLTRMFPIPRADLSTSLAPSRSTSPAGTSTSRSSRTAVNASLSINLWDRGNSLNQYKQSRIQVDRGSISVTQQELSLRQQIISQYFAARQAEQTIALENKLLQDRRTDSNTADLRFRNTLIGLGDMLGVEQAVRDQQNRVALAEDVVRRQKLALMSTMGVIATTDFTLVTEIPPIVDDVILNPDSIVALALAQNPGLRSAELAREATRMNAMQTRKSRFFPSVSANLSFGRSVSQPNYSAFLDPEGRNTSLSGSFSLGFSLSEFIDIPSMRLTQQQATASLYDADLTLRGQQLEVERAVRSAVIDLQAAYRSLAYQRNAVASRQKQVDIANQEFPAGKINYNNFQSIIDGASAAERQLLDAQLTVLTRRMALEVLLGIRPGG